MSSIDCWSPRKANGAIKVPVLTPVTASNSGLASGCWAGDLLPPLEEPRSECPPVTPTRDDQDVDDRRCFPTAGGVPVVLGLGAFERPVEQSAPFCYGLLVAFGAHFQEILLRNFAISML